MQARQHINLELLLQIMHDLCGSENYVFIWCSIKHFVQKRVIDHFEKRVIYFYKMITSVKVGIKFGLSTK